jgi:TetR/AcrR family transcriptional repressor of mexJK operon
MEGKAMSDKPIRRKPGRPKGTGSIETMQQILRTAAYLFMEHGFEKVSLEGVAQDCNITKASVYYHFRNKSVLFTECLQYVLKMAYEHTAKILAGEGPLQERMSRIALRHMSTPYVDFETMMREASSSLTEKQASAIRSSEHALHVLLAGGFQKGMDDGEINRSNPLLLAYMFTSMMMVRNRKEIINVHNSLDQISAEIVKLLWAGLAPRQPT